MLVAAADAYRHEGSRIVKIRGKATEASLRESEKVSRQKAYVAVMLLLDSGLRLGEALALDGGAERFLGAEEADAR